MFNLLELKQFVAFGELGSFSKVAQKFYVSTPTITRAMRRVEKEFGVELFAREGNKVALNDTGILAIECARRILHESETAIEQVRSFSQSKRTISVVSCAPAPLWTLAPRIQRLYPKMTLASRIANARDTEAALANEECDVAVLPYRPKDCPHTRHIMNENLFLCVKRNHPLAERDSVTLDDINGFNFLLASDLGFWNDLCQKRLPASRFLVQNDEFSLAEIIRSSSLPCFTTDAAIAQRYRDLGDDRVNIPISDEEASASFYLAANSIDKIERLFR